MGCRNMNHSLDRFKSKLQYLALSVAEVSVLRFLLDAPVYYEYLIEGVTKAMSGDQLQQSPEAYQLAVESCYQRNFIISQVMEGDGVINRIRKNTTNA